MELVFYLSELCRLLVLIVLLSAAYAKTMDMTAFAASLSNDFHVPAAFSRQAAFCVVVVEWLAFLAVLLGGSHGRIGAGLALLLLIAFSAVMLEAIVKGRRVVCSCFGRSTHPISSIDLLRNAGYIAAAGFYLVNAPYEMRGGWWAQISLLLAAALCFVVSVSMHEIRNLLR